MNRDDVDALQSAVSDRYRLERQIGAGGMATVFLAQDLKHRRNVAVKVLHPDLAASVGAERFLAEIRTTANLQHPHILPLHDSGEADGFLFYVMPFVTGESLRDRVFREQRLPIDDAVSIVREVADALDYAHRAGIVHRDIKPENILLSEGHAIVADFGIARAVSQSEPSNLTQAGQVIGTPAYLSPEQVTGEPLDGRSDLYSLGCVLYECLTGELPFSGSGVAMLTQRMVAPPPSAWSRRNDVPPQLDQVIRTAMATDPSARFSSCRAFSGALAAPMAAPPGRDGRAIVVLPFANSSPDADNEYFSDGLTEEISTDLAGIKSLRVISRTSAMRFKGTGKDVRAIGRELGVRYVLEGSVRKAGTSLRITARLVDAENDAQLWADKYGGTMDDVFELQERVSREIVRALGLTLTTDEAQRLAHRSITNVRAFELYLEARQELRRGIGIAIGTERGLALLERAIALEGESAPLLGLQAWAKVAQVKAGIGGAGVLDEVQRQADALLATAPDSPYGHGVHGYTLHERGRYLQAIGHFRQALARDPNDTDSRFFLGVSYVCTGLVEPAVETAARLVADDPLSSLSWIATGVAPWFKGEFAGSIASFRRALELDPQNFIAHWTIGYTHAMLGDLVAAADEVSWLVAHGPKAPYTIQLQSLVRSLEGDVAAGLAIVSAVDLGPFDPHMRFHFAESFAMAGATEHALGVLETAVEMGFCPDEFVQLHCRFLEPIRAHARFPRIVALATQRSASVREAVAAMTP
ncbi:MAG: protein kinase domain-containing protein [Gemmatimonadaceae bacterium]